MKVQVLRTFKKDSIVHSRRPLSLQPGLTVAAYKSSPIATEAVNRKVAYTPIVCGSGSVAQLYR